MPCDPKILKQVPLFALLDDDETAVLAAHVELKRFPSRMVRVRAARNPNVVIERDATFGERIADSVAAFGGSWTLIIAFMAFLCLYTPTNVVLKRSAWDPYPFNLLNLFLSMLAAIQARSL